MFCLWGFIMIDLEEFRMFFENIIDKKHLKKNELALKSGVAIGYLYKLLSGTKRTTERDYIIAMCVAAGFSLEETQMALLLYSMPVLDYADGRSHIIIEAILKGLDVTDLNAALESNGHNSLRTSPDMKKSVPNLQVESKLVKIGKFQINTVEQLCSVRVKDSNGKDYDLYLTFSENELEFWAENKGRVIESYNYLVEAENSMFFKIFIRMYNRLSSEEKS